MKLTVNGEAREVTPPCSVLTLLDRLGKGGVPCAVEVNGEVVTRFDHGARQLSEGDRVELVTLVGGG